MMDISIDDDSYEAIARASRHDDVFAIFSTDPAEGMQQIRLALSGTHASVREGLARRLKECGTPAPFSMVEARLYAHAGIDPLAVAALMIHASDCMLLLPGEDAEDEASCYSFIQKSAPTQGHIRIGSGVYWRMSGQIDVRLPEILRGAITLGPLQRTLSHPVLDPLHLSVVGVEEWDEDTMIRTDASRESRALDISELFDMRPAIHDKEVA